MPPNGDNDISQRFSEWTLNDVSESQSARKFWHENAGWMAGTLLRASRSSHQKLEDVKVYE
ncbi:hypothetical protein CGLO_12579 [Colletotrichum gloeosporioides Cg-14]|uniref:Uncharacterized protein n=1 Tax=Colletotrichum gloeosporioides (strain Cg-14) TaxID=1237896 RepID=T0L979_COLGC|nr:hypothetical protein CGLO_12579 [Colletotrichum gloeosporioides Cg-14]